MTCRLCYSKTHNELQCMVFPATQQEEEFLIELPCDHEVQTQHGDEWKCDVCGVVVE